MKGSNTPTYAYSVIFCLFAACMIMFPKEAFSAALGGLNLCLNVVYPALLPFFICVEILIGLGIVSLFGSIFKPLMKPVFNVPGEGSFGFFMSIASGYPVGAKITARLRRDGICTNAEGQRLLSLCSTSGPLFMIGAVATGMLKNPALGFIIAISHYLSAITIGFLMRYYKNYDKTCNNSIISNPITEMLIYRKKDGRPIGVLMGDAVKDGVNLILTIGGFIVFFSVITGILKASGLLNRFSSIISRAFFADQVSSDIISALLIGFLEVTNGAGECALLQLPIIYKGALISFLIGFGGLSINAQVMSIISETDLKFNVYIAFKLLQGVAAAIYSLIATVCFCHLPVLNTEYFNNKAAWNAYQYCDWLRLIKNSAINLILVLAFMLAVFLIKTITASGKDL